jgi:hypothetical protein
MQQECCPALINTGADASPVLSTTHQQWCALLREAFANGLPLPESSGNHFTECSMVPSQQRSTMPSSVFSTPSPMRDCLKNSYSWLLSG